MTGSGYVRIYKNVNNTWTQVGSDIDGEAAGDNSGRSVSLSADGNVVAIGSLLASEDSSGHVRIFKNINNIWTQIGSNIDGEDANSFSGRSVSLSSDGNVVAIGADWNDGNGIDSGHVRIYKNVNNTWTQVGSDIDGEAAGDRSGWTVSLSEDGSIVAIGATNNSANGNNSGHVRIYKNVNNTWTQVGSDIDGEAAADLSGTSLSLSADGSVVAIGAYTNDGSGTDSGHVRIYKNVNNTWTQVGSDIDGVAAEDSSGISVSLSEDGSVIAIGAPGNDGNGSNSGHTKVYQIDLDTTAPSAPISLTTIATKTNDNTPIITGIAEAGSTVKLYNGSILLGSAIAGTDGAFSITSSTLNDATYSLTATATDATGNTSPLSSVLSIEVNQNLITGDFEWAKLYGSSADEEANGGILIDNEGNIFFTGATKGNLNGEINNGNQDIFLLKLDSNGNEIWTKLYGSAANEIPYSISIDNENNIFITGTATGTLNGQINNGEKDAFVMKLNSAGGEIWTKIFGTELDDIAWGGTFDENVYLWGETHGNLNGEVNNYLGNEDAYLIKLDSNGNEIWTTLIGTELNEEAWDISVDSDYSVYLVGETQDSNVSNTDDILVSKIDQQGNLLWSKSFGEINKDDYAMSIEISTGGDLYVSGITESNLNGQIGNGGTDSFLMKLDKDGNEIWTKLYGTANSENAFDMGLRNDGYIYLTGIADPDDKGFLKKIDFYGNEIWTKYFGNSNWDLYGNLHIEDNGSAIYISGETRGDLENNLSNGETDAILYKFSDPFTLSESRALNYIASNPDLISAFVIDTEAANSHYTNYGISEGRSLTTFSATNYLAKYSDLSAAFGDDQTLALKHYIEYGFSEGRTDTSSSSVSGSGSSSNLTDLEAYNYIASHNDLISAFGIDIAAAKSHYTNYGKSEGRTLDDFDEWGYLASNNDLINSLGSDATEAVKHYISYGYSQGKVTNSFNAQSYLNNYADLRNAFGDNQSLATKHYVEYGFNEGRLF